MCTTVGLIVATPEPARMERLIRQWLLERPRAILFSSYIGSELDALLEGVDSTGALRYDIGAVGSGCACGIFVPCGGPDGGPASDPVAVRADLRSLLDLVCRQAFHWLRFGFTDDFHDVAVVRATMADLLNVLSAEELPDETVFHVEGSCP